MGTMQVSSTNVWPAINALPRPPRDRKGGHEKIETRASRPLGPNEPLVPSGRNKDWIVVQQANSGDGRAQELLFGQHTRRLFHTTFAILHNKEDAEDALQDGLCMAFRNLSSFQGKSSFSTWLTRIVINAALMARRRLAAHPEPSLDEILEGDPDQLPAGMIDKRPDPERICAHAEVSALVEDQVRQLSPEQQAAYRLRLASGFSVAESAKALGVQANVFKARITRVRRKLASGLGQSLEIGSLRGRRYGHRVCNTF